MMPTPKEVQLARTALAHWGGEVAPPELVHRSENVVFRARLRDGTDAALRLHRPGYQGRAGVEAELDWCARLAAQGFATPAPVATLAGRWTAMAGRHVVSCLRWVDAEPLAGALDPLGVQALQDACAVGALLGRLHGLTDAGAVPPGFVRKPWDSAALLGARPRWGRFWENPTLTEPETGTLLQARSEAVLRLAQARDFGPIHADALRGNVLRGAQGLWLIDFDDCGPGYRLYDLASALVQSWGDPLWAAQAQALVQGYRQERALPADQAALLGLFVGLRAFASAGWIVTRAAPGDPRLRLYAQRALHCARALLAGRDPWEPS